MNFLGKIKLQIHTYPLIGLNLQIFFFTLKELSIWEELFYFFHWIALQVVKLNQRFYLLSIIAYETYCPFY